MLHFSEKAALIKIMDNPISQPASYYGSRRPDICFILPKTYNTVLEIGCGGGGFSSFLKKGIDLWGIEPDMAAANHAESMGYHVFQSDYESASDKLPNQYFDLVICNDVIEHMPDHEHFFDVIKSKMSPSGVIVGSVPNMRNYRALYELLIKKDWPYMEQGVLDKTHLRWFTEKSLRDSLKKSGYSIEVFQGIGSLLGNTSSVSSIFKSVVVAAAIASTLGYYRDIRFLQYAFRVRLSDEG